MPTPSGIANAPCSMPFPIPAGKTALVWTLDSGPCCQRAGPSKLRASGQNGPHTWGVGMIVVGETAFHDFCFSNSTSRTLLDHLRSRNLNSLAERNNSSSSCLPHKQDCRPSRAKLALLAHIQLPLRRSSRRRQTTLYVLSQTCCCAPEVLKNETGHHFGCSHAFDEGW